MSKTPTSRRSFCVAGAWGLGTMGLSLGGALSGRAAPMTRRRHFINIQGFGGWDSAWHHSPVLLRDAAGLSEAQLKSSFYGVYDTPRFMDDLAMRFDDHFVGIGMSGFSSTELGDLLIWRGIREDGSHDLGNRNIQNGSLSGYAASYSTLIAHALAQSPDYLRPLHFVQTTNTPAEFRSQFGFFTGPAIPINLASLDNWTRLSATDPADPINTDALRGLLDGTMTNLMGMTGQLKAPSRVRYEEDFGTNFNATKEIRNKNYATNPAYDFTPTMDRYRSAVVSYIAKVLFDTRTAAAAREGLKNFSDLPTAEGALRDFLTRYFGGSLDSLVYPYAVADFLVRYDLSAVVDATARLGDFHDDNHRDFLQVMASLACFKELIGSLKATPVSPTSSQSLFDVTTVMMSTEFDRTIHRYPQNSNGFPGTNHGVTSSTILTGYGVNSGKIVGARGSGPLGPFASAGGYLQPLPIDFRTGKPSASGQIVNNTAIQPTILQIFGQSQPQQQNIGEKAVDAVIKPGHSGV